MKRTTRVFAAVAAAMLVTGVLLYVGTRGHSKPGFEEHLPKREALPAGVAAGKLHARGGTLHPGSPRVTPDSPIPGTVEAHRPGDPVPLYDAPIGADGLFRIQLPPGDYELVARPTNVGIDPPSSQDVTIRDGKTVHVDFVIVVG